MTKAADLPLPELACAMMWGVSLLVMNMGMVRCWILDISSRFSSAIACGCGKEGRARVDKVVERRAAYKHCPPTNQTRPPSYRQQLLGDARLRVRKLHARVQGVVLRQLRQDLPVLAPGRISDFEFGLGLGFWMGLGW